MRAASLVLLVILTACSDTSTQQAGTTATHNNNNTHNSTTTHNSNTTTPTTTALMSGLGVTSVPPSPDANGVTTTQPETTTTTTTTVRAACASPAIGVTETTLVAGGAEHAVRFFVPSSFAGAPLPVVLDWHGLGSNGTEQAMYSDYEAVAEEQGFIVVHPTGVADAPGGPNSWQLFPNAGGERDDLAFAGSLIDELVANWCADPARVYSTGMSNGGFFTARLICDMSDRIAAAVSVAGMYHPEMCSPDRDVPYMAIHGTADEIVPFLGGGESLLAGADADPSRRVFFDHVIPTEFAEFAADAGCETKTTDTAVSEDVIRHEYVGCDGDVPMIFDEVQHGGHTWPSSPLASFTEGALGYTTEDIDATRDGWAFMSRFTLDGL